jgi:hypothetical protein
VHLQGEKQAIRGGTSWIRGSDWSSGHVGLPDAEYSPSDDFENTRFQAYAQPNIIIIRINDFGRGTKMDG